MIPQIAAGNPVRHAALALALAALLGGCSLAPTYERPSVALPASFAAAQAPAAGAPDATAQAQELTAQELEFLRSFAPRTDLAPLVKAALAHNADYRLAALQVEQARAQYRIERSARLPTVGVDAQRIRQIYDDPDLQLRFQQELSVATVGIGDFELDFFGKLKSLSDAARARYLASTHGQQAARGALIAEVVRAYTLERTAAQSLAIQRSIEADATILLGYAARQHAVGLLSQDDLGRQRAEADLVHVRTRQAADDHRAAQRALRVLAGFDAGQTGGELNALVSDQVATTALRGLNSEVLLQRPDVQQAEAELRARNADIGAARAAFFPSIRLSTGLGTASSALSGLFDSGSRTWSFIPQITLPIFDFGRNRSNLDLAQVRKQAGIVEYERTIESAFREVADALDAHATLGDARQRSQAYVQREQARVERMRVRVEHGLQDRSALLEERVQLGRAELDNLAVERDVALNRIAVFRAFYGVRLPAAS
ncbi:efflux transporter outer membrane subunit [Xanthomonas phaseoli]|uniref:efflux transporter outer membrane subunit n=1 Tax=Xanthomonas phaseoli TaxID=1985254 RepID=UPI001ADB4290|nr:efflux transporter outer membrane subunit [Xanthomonas phaseoli]MBO9969144.1 efflux transporter outer membrane subunit [Xanthomonas phaseoli pv. dieffenbachiae]MBO9988013.1 efflux transporter outer membrane subunit [Xanthomonas phaseoli pv. dieffenbachiae]